MILGPVLLLPRPQPPSSHPRIPGPTFSILPLKEATWKIQPPNVLLPVLAAGIRIYKQLDAGTKRM